MKNLRMQLLASAAVMALSSTAYAADMGPPLKAPPPAPIPYSNWQGFYVGGNVGVARMNSSCTQTTGELFASGCSAGFNGTTSTSLSATGVAAGVQVGYDWQDRYFVYGVAADWSWTNLKHTINRSFGLYGAQAKVDWLASFRGRVGLALDNNLLYFTGGLALGQVKGFATSTPFASSPVSYGNLDKTQVGWVAGIGFEHKFTPNWSAFTEFLYYDLGRVTANGPGASGASGPGANYQTEWNFEVFEGRVGVNYRF